MSFASQVADAWAKPPASFRGAPFWSWNSLLDPDRLCRAIQSMHEAGLGGFFMHSRYGLKTPYLSDEWFRCISACVEQARKLGMKAYLYDEDRWPSGAAGGLVTRDKPDNSAKVLICGPPTESDTGESIALFAVHLDANGALVDCEAIEDASQAPADALVISCRVRVADPSGWHNDGAYLDTMDPDAVAEFILVTYRAYADRYGDDFGELIPAIFTDEPNVPWAWAIAGKTECGIPWTTDLPRQFKQRRGYDIRDHLAELVLPQTTDEFSRLRYDYFRTITEVFVENFTMQIGNWCARQSIAMTGHMLGEGTLFDQIRAVGAAMPHYEHMQWPGIDILGDQADELSTAKQCSSVADQLGRTRVLSETYGCTGWDWPLEGHKFVGDWQFASGVNFRCPHLTHYSLAGGAKRDYPASIFSHSPWWKYYSTVEDYFARLSLMLTQGVPVRDVLVIHPVESAWGLFRPGAESGEAFMSLEKTWRSVMYDLSGGHYDWDFGDESLLAKYAKVSDAAINVGRMTYRVVVVPGAWTLRATTVALLQRFTAGGGKVLFVDRVADQVDAQPSEEVRELAGTDQARVVDADSLVAAIEDILPRRVSVTPVDAAGGEANQVWTMLRRVKGGQVLFMQSHDRSGPQSLKMDVLGRRPVVLWDTRTGERLRVRSDVKDDRVSFEVELGPSGSALLTLGISVPDAIHPPKEQKVVERKEIDGPFEVELEESNSMPLDYCSYSFEDEAFSEPMPTLRADAQIRKRFGLGARLGGEHQPWYLYATGVVDTAGRGRCRMRRVLHVTDVPARCALAIEQPENFRLTVNGKLVEGVSGWWVDEDIKTVDISGALQAGDNEILLDFNYRPDMELEDMYLVGDFAVAARTDSPPAPGNVTVVSPAKTLQLGSWVGQGLDFYGGAVNYKIMLDAPAQDRRLRVSLPGVSCTAAAIHVGGQTFVLPWAPFEADITDAMAEGANEVTIEVIGGRKNILGPMHVPWRSWTGPGEFSPDHHQWTDEYLLTDHGLTAPIVVETLA